MLLKFLYSVKSFASGSIHICKYFSLSGPNKDFWRDQLNTHLKHIHKQILTIILYQRKMINTFGLLMPCYLQERRLGPFHLKISSTNCVWQRCPSCSSTGCKQVTITGKYREKVKIPTHWTDHGAKITSKKKCNYEIDWIATGFCLSIVNQGINKCISNATVIEKYNTAYQGIWDNYVVMKQRR